MAEDVFNKKIGNKEQKSLEAKPVVVQGKVLEPVMGKAGSKNAGKEVGKKLCIIVKHPDRQEPISISSIVIVSGKSIKNSTMWWNEDEDGNIVKNSPIAILLQKYGAETLNDLDGKVLQTELDESKFLTIKGY